MSSAISSLTSSLASASLLPSITSSLDPSPSPETDAPSPGGDKCDGPPYASLPAFESIPELPEDVNIGMIGGSNVSHAPMVHCCAPNPVQLVDGCYLWCAMPEPAGGFPKGGDSAGNFSRCLRNHEAWNTSEQRIFGATTPNVGGRTAVPLSYGLTTVGMGVWGLVMMGLFGGYGY